MNVKKVTESLLAKFKKAGLGPAVVSQRHDGKCSLIWHVDDALTAARGINPTGSNVPNSVNIGTPHYGVSIVSV